MESLIQFGLSEAGAAALKSGLRVMHLLGLVLGLGAATLIDLIACKFLANEVIHEEQWRVVRYSSQVVTIGLVILWVSGLGFLAHYALFSPVNLGNPKVWAKMAIVGILSLNGFFIHARILPFIQSRIGCRLFDGVGRRQKSLILASGAVSVTSWFVPLGLGAIPQLNFVVPATTILLGYAVILAVAIATSARIGQFAGLQLDHFGERSEFSPMQGELGAETGVRLP